MKININIYNNHIPTEGEWRAQTLLVNFTVLEYYTGKATF